MTRVLAVFLGASLLIASNALAAPLLSQKLAPPSMTENVKIICDEGGNCVRAGRRPVARWVYGEGNFYGPYAGPGYYGSPRLRYRVFPYFWW